MRGCLLSMATLAALAWAPNEAGHGAAPPAPGGGPGAAPPAPPTNAAPPPAPPPAPKVNEDEIRAKAEAELLKKLGLKDADEAKAILKAHREAEAAKLTEAERQKKALDDAMNARAEVEAKAEKHAARVKELEEQVEMRDRLDAQGVAPKERALAEAAYRNEKALKGKDFDEAKFWEEQKKERPFLFGSSTAPLASTTTKPTGTAPQPGVLPPNQGQAPAQQRGPGKYDHLPWVGGAPPARDFLAERRAAGGKPH